MPALNSKSKRIIEVCGSPMRFRPPSYSLQIVALVIVAAFVMLISAADTTRAHGTFLTQHDLAMSGPLSHWSDGRMDYKFEGSFPANWTTRINQAASHMANNTFALQVGNNNSSDNQIYIGKWPAIPFGNCQPAGILGGTEACTYPVNCFGTVDALIGTNLKHHLYRVHIVFDEADVYQGTDASRTVRSKWGVITSGTSRLQKVAAHELGHALGFFDHIPGSGSLMYHTAPHCTLSVDDKWNLNRLFCTRQRQRARV